MLIHGVNLLNIMSCVTQCKYLFHMIFIAKFPPFDILLQVNGNIKYGQV